MTVKRKQSAAQLANLKPIPFNQRTKEEMKRIGTMGGKASQAKQKEKKLMSQILADYLVKTHRVKIGKKEIDLTADQIIDKGISRAILSGSNATVGMIKEIREGTGDQGHAGSDGTRKALDHFDALRLAMKNNKDGEG